MNLQFLPYSTPIHWDYGMFHHTQVHASYKKNSSHESVMVSYLYCLPAWENKEAQEKKRKAICLHPCLPRFSIVSGCEQHLMFWAMVEDGAMQKETPE